MTGVAHHVITLADSGGGAKLSSSSITTTTTTTTTPTQPLSLSRLLIPDSALYYFVPRRSPNSLYRYFQFSSIYHHHKRLDACPTEIFPLAKQIIPHLNLYYCYHCHHNNPASILTIITTTRSYYDHHHHHHIQIVLPPSPPLQPDTITTNINTS
ncbi:hypothetical protein E2C01_057931 [Portunus trituberculatus]|uniref:Uncharacterized protein n=1 Tax=Portunus trituberculatus TaxID=210409 RepID=A0A5B7H2F0_PORTR|nr:hypothetical protein [Portunus trituberculatus]